MFRQLISFYIAFQRIKCPINWFQKRIVKRELRLSYNQMWWVLKTWLQSRQSAGLIVLWVYYTLYMYYMACLYKHAISIAPYLALSLALLSECSQHVHIKIAAL